MLPNEAGSQRDVDDARAALQLAKAALESAEKRRELLAAMAQSGTDATSLRIASPFAGMLLSLHAAPGQLVAAGTALFEVASLDRVWIRVPVYVGDLPDLDLSEAALVGGLGGEPNAALRPAEPVSGPPSASAHAATADLFYEIENADGRLRPGQKVGVTLSMRDPVRSLVVPWQAVLYDAHGGAWVYEQTKERVYTRRRVQVRYVVDSVAALARGPARGAKIVTAGAAELFGTEFGTGK